MKARYLSLVNDFRAVKKRHCLKKLRIRKNTELFKNTYILKYNIFIIIYLHRWEDLLWHSALTPLMSSSSGGQEALGPTIFFLFLF